MNSIENDLETLRATLGNMEWLAALTDEQLASVAAIVDSYAHNLRYVR